LNPQSNLQQQQQQQQQLVGMAAAEVEDAQQQQQQQLVGMAAAEVEDAQQQQKQLVGLVAVGLAGAYSSVRWQQQQQQQQQQLGQVQIRDLSRLTSGSSRVRSSRRSSRSRLG
jgi:hypothetical protein